MSTTPKTTATGLRRHEVKMPPALLERIEAARVRLERDPHLSDGRVTTSEATRRAIARGVASILDEDPEPARAA